MTLEADIQVTSKRGGSSHQGEYAKQAQLCAAENKDYIHYLARLYEMGLIDRERRMIERRIKAAKFPSTKSLDSFDFKIMPSLNKPLTMELARCDYVDRRENIIALGPSGTGKTHIALGLGLDPIKNGGLPFILNPLHLTLGLYT